METQSYGYRPDLAPVAQLAARRSHNPKVASSILAGSMHTIVFFLRVRVCPHKHVLGEARLRPLLVNALSTYLAGPFM